MKTEKEGDESRHTAWESAENTENLYAFNFFSYMTICLYAIEQWTFKTGGASFLLEIKD